jgi:2'-5' RNA ligase
MRLFVALSPPEAALTPLAAAVAALRADWPALRWASQDRWHVTLAFLGEVDESKLAGLSTRLERAARRHQGSDLLIGRGGAFPSPARARVLISHIETQDGDLTGLIALARSVSAAARRAGAPPPDEGRKYRPHLTLARTREPADLTALVRALSGPYGPRWRAGDIHLVHSQLGPSPRYETLESWTLRPA